MTVTKNTQLENDAEALRREVRSLAARNDIDGLAQIPRDQLELRRAEAAERLEVRSNRLLEQDRGPTDREDTLSRADLSEIEALDAALILAERNATQEQRVQDRMQHLDQALNRNRERAVDPGALSRRHPSLLVSDAHLRSHADAIRTGSTFGAEEVFERAAVTVATDFGSPGSWDDGGIPNPTPLRAFAGIPEAKLTGATAQHPSLTLPTGAAGVAEGTNAGEYDTVNVGNLSTLRYGRWTQVTSFVNEFDQLRALNSAHAVGIARDLDLADITTIQTAAGSVTAFDATNLDRNVRQAILKVAAAALVPPSEVVLFGTSAAMGVVTGYAPASGDDRGSVATRVYGARVYVSEAATAGNVYAFAPQGFIVFQTPIRSATTMDPKNGSPTFGQWMHSTPAGVFIVGAAAGVDVVTP
jgi:hypothetical protein